MPKSGGRTKTALVLASGGVAGVAYEAGALRALDHILVNRSVNDFDIYVGTSAGAVVAASMASGVPPVMLAGLIAGTVPNYKRFGRLTLYRPNVGEFIWRISRAPALVRDSALEYWRFRDRMPFSEAVASLLPLLPSGIFSNAGLEEFMRHTFMSAGLSDDFRDIPKELHIVATDIETDERVAFSRLTHANVPISRAVAASTCIPILFRPVEINGNHYVDGGIKSHAAIDVAINRGANLVVIINGLVPLDARAIARKTELPSVRKSIYELGIRAIGNQVLRGMLHDSLTDHLRTIRERHPEVDFILIEPRPDDEKMFFHEVMSFSAQLIVLQHGYESVVQGLQRSWPYLKRILTAHGIEITRDIVRQKPEEVPVWVLEERATLLGRLRQTVLDRRVGDNRSGISTARVASARRKVATPASAAGTGRRRASGKFRPRVISSEGA